MTQRWAVKSLRRFKDREIIINIYLAIGGVLSLLYTLAAVWRAKLYVHVFSLEMISHGNVIGYVALQIILRAILRTLMWLPQLIYAMLFQHQSLWDWMTAAALMKDLS